MEELTIKRKLTVYPIANSSRRILKEELDNMISKMLKDNGLKLENYRNCELTLTYKTN